MSGSRDLLTKLQNTSVKKIAEKEQAKHAVLEDAHNIELINQSKNRTKFGTFAIDWIIVIIAIATSTLIFMTTFYIGGVIQDPLKLEKLLITFYAELKLFFANYQTILAVIVTLMFGDKLKKKNDPS